MLPGRWRNSRMVVEGDGVLKATNVYLPEDVHKALRMEAFEQGVSMTELVRQLIEDYLRKAGRKLATPSERIRPGPKRTSPTKTRK